MGSFQSGAINLFIRAFQRTLFVHKTETITHRNGFEKLSNIAKFPRHVIVENEDIADVEGAWFVPARKSDKKTILYLHGGGYCVGSFNTHRALIARIARSAGASAYAINYRKAPEHPFPAGLDDAIDVYMELLNLGHKNIIIGGDSAGGGLCLALMQKLRASEIEMPIGAFLISPWTDLTFTGDTIKTKANVDPLIPPELLSVFANKYIGEYEASNPLISPLFADFDEFPPIYIQVGGHEVLLDDSTRLAKNMKEQGVNVSIDIYPAMMHVFQWLGGMIPEANKAIAQIGEFIKNLPLADQKKQPEQYSMKTN